MISQAARYVAAILLVLSLLRAVAWLASACVTAVAPPEATIPEPEGDWDALFYPDA